MPNNMQSNAGTNVLTEQIIATDLMLNAKAGIKNYAMALTETASPEVRTILKKQLGDAINMHERIASYMINRGYYNAGNLQAQIQADIQASNTVMSL